MVIPIYFLGVDDGLYVMLSPVPAGPHQTRFHGVLSLYSFTLDIAYYLMVAK